MSFSRLFQMSISDIFFCFDFFEVGQYKCQALSTYSVLHSSYIIKYALDTN